MKKTEQRFWIIAIVSVVAGVCIIIGLRVAMEVVIIDNNLRKEELTLSREIVKQLSEIKSMLGQMKAGVPPPGREEPRMPPPKPGTKKVEGVTSGMNPIKGDSNAPVLMVQFSDFECPFSKRFYQETLPQIDKEYISTGKVKFAYRDFPLPFHLQAQPAAIASRCAGKQGKYWEIFDKFSKSDKLDQNMISMSAKEIGLNKDEFNRCLKDPAVKEQVVKDMNEGSNLGVRGTPAFFINGRFIEGAIPFEAFKEVIDEELNKTKK